MTIEEKLAEFQEIADARRPYSRADFAECLAMLKKAIEQRDEIYGCAPTIADMNAELLKAAEEKG